MSPKDKPLAWLHGEVKTPPFSQAARLEAGYLLRELRVVDQKVTWRIVYRIDADAIVIAEVFAKKTAQTPSAAIAACQKRLKEYDDAAK